MSPIVQCFQINRRGCSCLMLESGIQLNSWLGIPVLMSVLLEEGLNGNSGLVWTDAGQ